ncbi:unnamed protein product [Discosporangium mesarthrocarpum]
MLTVLSMFLALIGSHAFNLHSSSRLTSPKLGTESTLWRTVAGVNINRRLTTLHCASEDDLDNIDFDRAQREANDLDEMIRGRRGITVEAVEREWKNELSRIMEESGERVCAEAYRGYLGKGRGAINVNVDVSMSNNREGHSGVGLQAVYCSLEEVVMGRSARIRTADQMQIIQRCQEYDPEVGCVLRVFLSHRVHTIVARLSTSFICPIKKQAPTPFSRSYSRS